MSVPNHHRAGPLPDDWVLPVVDDFNREWFTSGAITLQQCTGCATLQHPPEEICHVCGSMTFVPHAVAPAGVVHSYTIVHHSVHPALDAAVPYAVVLIALDDAPRLRVVGNLIGVPVTDVRIGMSVAAIWEELADADGSPVFLPQWQRGET
ncbi:MAG: OB-fold domain-containing protein [Ilumatobacteraceae bacterium]